LEKQLGTIAKQYDENRFTKIDIIKNRRSTAFYLNFLPEQHMKPHTHPGRELYLHVLEGRGTLFIDDETVEIKVGDVIYCDPEEKIGFTNSGKDPATIYGVMTKVD
jgi:quercetin dioxygenase-like cupin family protein